MNEKSNDLHPSNHHVSYCRSGGSEGRPPHPTPVKFDVQFERDGDSGDKSTNQVNTIRSGILSHIFGNPVVFHPFTNDLERRYFGGNSKERDDVGML